MSYLFYIDDILLPVSPSKLDISIENQNKTINLINDGEVNILKQAGLTNISLEFLLPNVNYPFAVYEDGFLDAKHYLDRIEELKLNLQPFQFIVTRNKPLGGSVFNTNIKVSIEGYSIIEAVEDGFDVKVSIDLKQYRDYGTKVCTINDSSSSSDSGSSEISVEVAREVVSSPLPSSTQTYTVIKGDSLWKIAKYFYGNGSKYSTIYEANKDIISNPSLIYPNQVLVIPNI